MTTTSERDVSAGLDHIEYDPPIPVDLPAPSMAITGKTGPAIGGRPCCDTPGRRRSAPYAARRTGYNPLSVPLRLACGDLGATYVKFGQFVGSAPDIVGENVSDEFRSCLDAGPPIPFDDVRRIVEADLGRPLHELLRRLRRAAARRRIDRRRAPRVAARPASASR